MLPFHFSNFIFSNLNLFFLFYSNVIKFIENLTNDFPNSKYWFFQAFQEQVECKKNHNWEPRKTPVSRNMLICSICIIIFSFLFIIFSFIFIMFGYELFCVEFFESDSVKYYIESRKNATNQTCPDIWAIYDLAKYFLTSNISNRNLCLVHLIFEVF